MYKLICVDLDGTLLDSHSRVSLRNKEAIRKALDSGINVAIVSGRPNCFTIRIMDQISGRMGHITFNGAYYRIANKSKTFPIDPEVVNNIAAMAKAYQVRLYFKNKNLCLCTKSDPGILDYDRFKEQTPIKDRMDMYYNVDVVEYLKTHQMNVLKIFAWDEEWDNCAKIAKILAAEKRINLFVYDDYFELSSAQTSKGKAIVNVCKDLDIPLDEVMCIGDNFNDMPMFEVAGLSVAMANAPQQVREYCDKVTLSNDENGVAYAIEHYALEEL